jgi:hypothetical protein
MAAAGSDQGVFHDHGVLADADLAVLGGEHGAVQDPHASADLDVSDNDC